MYGNAIAMFVRAHKSALIKVGAAVAGAVVGGLVAAAFIRMESGYDEDDGMLNMAEEGDDEDELDED